MSCHAAVSSRHIDRGDAAGLSTIKSEVRIPILANHSRASPAAAAAVNVRAHPPVRYRRARDTDKRSARQSAAHVARRTDNEQRRTRCTHIRLLLAVITAESKPKTRTANGTERTHLRLPKRREDADFHSVGRAAFAVPCRIPTNQYSHIPPFGRSHTLPRN
jgi:hypothetical protein